MDTETAAYFLTVPFITLGIGIFNPSKRILHFDLSLRLTGKILKVPASWGQQISTPEKGQLRPPCFVVDYRSLNAVTLTNGYPIPSALNILDTIYKGKLVSKFELAADTGR